MQDDAPSDRMLTGRAAAVVLGCVAAGGAVTLWGLFQQQWPHVLPWRSLSAAVGYVGFLVVTAAAIGSGARWIRRDPIVITVAVGCLLALCAGALWSLVVVLAFALAAILVGRFVLSALRCGHESEWWVALLVGAGSYGTLAGILTHFPINVPALYLVLLIAPLFLWRAQALECLGAVRSWLTAPSDLAGIGWWASVALGSVTLFHFVVSFLPEIGHDALAMHLFIPAHLAARHEWSYDPGQYIWAVTPMLADWLYAFVYMLGGETSSRLVNVGFLFLLAVLLHRVTRWLGADESGGRWAALLFVATPLAYLESNTLFIDLAWTAFLACAVFSVARRLCGDEAASLRPVLLLLGFAASTKWGTVALLPILALLCLVRAPVLMRARAGSGRWLGALPAAAVGVVVGGIPYVTAWIVAGNPLFPFMNDVFQSPYYAADRITNPLWMQGLTWDVLYRWMFDSGKYLEATTGASGFHWLVLFVPAVVITVMRRSRRALLLLLVGVAFVAIVFSQQSYLRYVFLSFFLFSALIGHTLSRDVTSPAVRRVLLFAAVATVWLNTVFLPSATFAHRNFPVAALFDSGARQEYLLERAPIREAIAFANFLNKGQIPIAILGPALGAGADGDVLYSTWYNPRFFGEITGVESADQVAEVLTRNNVAYVLLDERWKMTASRSLVEEATRTVAAFGTVTVRELLDQYQFGEELLANAAMDGPESWSFGGDVEYLPMEQAFRVKKGHPATQRFPVTAGRRCRNTVIARSEIAGAQVRTQVNWMDGNGKFLTTHIRVFDCESEWQEYSQEIVAPNGAAVGVAFAVAHGSEAVLVRSVSVR